MARTRSIKPDFFTDDELAECSALARLLFIGLWCVADARGRLEDRPKKIKVQVLPFDRCDPNRLLSELAESGHIVRYSVGEKSYIEIRNFGKHQKPHHGERGKYEEDLAVGLTIPPPQPVENSTHRTRERTGNEPSTNRARSNRADPDPDPDPDPDLDQDPLAVVGPETPSTFLVFPTDGDPGEYNLLESKVAEYEQTYKTIDVRTELTHARQWCLDNPAKRKTAGGMPAFLSRWLKRAVDSPRKGNGQARKPVEHEKPPAVRLAEYGRKIAAYRRKNPDDPETFAVATALGNDSLAEADYRKLCAEQAEADQRKRAAQASTRGNGTPTRVADCLAGVGQKEAAS